MAEPARRESASDLLESELAVRESFPLRNPGPRPVDSEELVRVIPPPSYVLRPDSGPDIRSRDNLAIAAREVRVPALPESCEDSLEAVLSSLPPSCCTGPASTLDVRSRRPPMFTLLRRSATLPSLIPSALEVLRSGAMMRESFYKCWYRFCKRHALTVSDVPSQHLPETCRQSSFPGLFSSCHSKTRWSQCLMFCRILSARRQNPSS